MGASPGFSSEFRSAWEKEPDRTWIGADFWANRLQDWRIRDGRVECVAKPALPMRTAHVLTHRLSGTAGFTVAVSTGPSGQPGKRPSERGFLIGAGGAKMDFRAAAIVHQWQGPGGGFYAGADSRGKAFIRDNETDWTKDQPADGPGQQQLESVRLELRSTMVDAENTLLVISAIDPKTTVVISKAEKLVPAARLTGNLALVSHAGGPGGQQSWFSDFELAGDGVISDPAGAVGPIIAAQHTLSRNVLKLTAQLMPVGDAEPRQVFLEAKHNGKWEPIAEAELITPGWTATFRVPGWNSGKDIPYRVVYGPATWTGVIRKDPVEAENLVVAGFTGNHNNAHAIGRADGLTDWVSGMYFPHSDLTSNIVKHKPDVLFFSGDQVYEGKSPTFADREEIVLDYMYKWYLWCWAYRDLTKDIPAVTIPDDHDVYQGNIWGEGGRPIHIDNAGGYVHPADFVQVVHRTQTSHLPDPPDPDPVQQNIPVYFTDMTYGRVSFAILEDRKWKSGCADHGLPPSGTGRPDHFNNPDFDTRQLDFPGLKLLGDRQLRFLDAWAADWTGSDLKVALSQTIFANMATHHGPSLEYLIADLDSNGWPQSGRNRAVAALRKAFAFHLAGDQHLATVVHHGIDMHRDSIYSFCVPSVANFYPRMWNPRRGGLNGPDGAPQWMGDHFDGFMNLVTVFAASNPGHDFEIEPKDLHNKMPGYGIVRLNKVTREIEMECWPRWADPDNPAHSQYPNWPVKITQLENYGRKPAGYLPPLEVAGLTNPVVQIRESATKELIYALRVNGAKFTPWVFEPGRYDMRIGNPDTGQWTELKGIEAQLEPYTEARLIEF